MPPQLAAAVVALRPALEGLVVRASKEPEQVTELSPLDNKVINVIRQLCKFNAGRFGMEEVAPSMPGYSIIFVFLSKSLVLGKILRILVHCQFFLKFVKLKSNFFNKHTATKR